MHASSQAVPFAMTQPATLATATMATLHGMAVPNGGQSTAWFEWGVRGTFTQQTPLQELNSGPGVFRVSQSVNGLTNRGIYQFRLVVSNEFGVTYGSKHFFTTGRRLVGWNHTGQIGFLCALPSNAVAIARGGNTAIAITADQATAVQWLWCLLSIVPIKVIFLGFKFPNQEGHCGFDFSVHGGVLTER